MDNLKKKSIKGYIWSLSGNFSNLIVGFVISIILTRLLDPKDFGLIAMVNVFFIFSNDLLNVGLGAALIQRKRLLPIHYSSVFYLNILIGLLLTVIIFFSANIIAKFYEQPILEQLIKVMSSIFLINSITIIQDIKLKKKLDFKQIAIFRFISTVTSGIVGVFLAYNNWGVWSLLIQQILNKIIYAILVWSKLEWSPQLAFSIKALKQLWKFGLNIFIANFLNSIYTQFDILIIGRIFPITTLGYYQRAKSLDNMVVKFSSTSLIQVLFPVISSIQNEIVRLKALVNKTLLLLSFVTFFMIGILYLCSENIIILLYTSKWLSSAKYFKLLLLSSFVHPYSALFINIIIGRGNSKDNLKLGLLKKIPLTANLLIGFLYGINGFLYGLVIASIISFIMNIYFIKKELGVNYFWFFKPMAPSLLLSIFLVLIINYINNLFPEINNFIALIYKGSAFTFCFIVVSYLLKFESIKLFISESKSIYKKQKQ